MNLKTIRKTLAFAITLVMLVVLALPAMAVDGQNKLKIKSKTAGHTFQAYQVFDGDYFEGVLSNVTWGDGVQGSALLTALKADNTLKTHFAACQDAADVAAVLSAKSSPFTDNSELLDQLANVVAQHLTTTKYVSGEPTGQAPALVYEIANLKDGYYFVNEADMSDTTGNAYTKFMLQVVGETEVDAKADVPSIDKKITETSGDTAYGDAAIGDVVNFKLTSAVPNMDGYEKYFFVVHDTLSTGLTFNNNVTISIGDKPLTNNTDYTVKTENQQITIVFNNFIQYKNDEDTPAGTPIAIQYSATVNKDAVVGIAGNPNDVYLTYSNNPNVAVTGTDEPAKGDPVGETPHHKTYTYVTSLEIHKQDPDDNPLAGAQFKLSGTALNKVLVYKDKFTEAEDGTYWKLLDGTYTTTEPTPDTKDKYADTEKKYKHETVTEEVTASGTSAAKEITGWVDNSGVLRINGLKAGTYTLTELTAPNGYNLLEQPIEFTVNWTAPQNPAASTDCTWTVSGNSGATVQDGIIKLTVENQKGATLPETGGIGTTIFYVLGGVLVVVAGVLLVAKKRMANKKDKSV